MIEVTRLSGTPLVLNADLIEAIESSPDTTILLTNARRYVVKERVDMVLEKVASWKHQCYRGPLSGDAALRRRELDDRARQES